MIVIITVVHALGITVIASIPTVKVPPAIAHAVKERGVAVGFAVVAVGAAVFVPASADDGT